LITSPLAPTIVMSLSLLAMLSVAVAQSSFGSVVPTLRTFGFVDYVVFTQQSHLFRGVDPNKDGESFPLMQRVWGVPHRGRGRAAGGGLEPKCPCRS